MKVLAILPRGGSGARNKPRPLCTVENELGLREYLESHGHTYFVSDSKEGPGNVFDSHIADAEILITTPFYPVEVSRDVFEKAKKLKLCVTAGTGCQYIDLNAAVKESVQVLEVGDSYVSIAEHVVMSILLLVKNFVPAHEMVKHRSWQVSKIACNAFDLKGKVVGTIGAGLVGRAVLERLAPFGCSEFLYWDSCDIPEDEINEINARRVPTLKELVSKCHVVTVNCLWPREPTPPLINEDLLKLFKPGAWLVNASREGICDKVAVAKAVDSGQLNGYAGDFWDVQPAPDNHPWRTLKNHEGGGNGMVPHYSGFTNDAQARYAQGTRDIIERHLERVPQDPENDVIQNLMRARVRNSGAAR